MLWGFRPVGLALLVAALVRISRAALKGPFAVALATLAFVAFYVVHLPFLVVLIGCGAVYIGWRGPWSGARSRRAARRWCSWPRAAHAPRAPPPRGCWTSRGSS